jgi:signal transduction histidine kinase
MKLTSWCFSQLKDVVAHIAGHAEGRAEIHGVSLVVGAVPEVEIPLRLRADVIRSMQELVRNAVKNADPRKTDRFVRIDGELRPSGRVCIRVIDNGVGIADVKAACGYGWQERPGTSRDADSRGIGLYSVAELAKRSGMQFELRSTPGEGTIAELIFSRRALPDEGFSSPSGSGLAGMSGGVGDAHGALSPTRLIPLAGAGSMLQGATVYSMVRPFSR